ncbi:MAG: hypothetical protein ACE5EX_09300 [Phycisphaerae bacterium]
MVATYPLGTVALGGQVVEVQLRAALAPGVDETTELPASVAEVCLGNTAYVEVWVTNLGPDPPGIAGGTIDISFPTDLIDATEIDHGTVFDLLVTGEIDGAAGIVDDLGGVTLQGGMAAAPIWALLARVAFTAVDAGKPGFSLSAGALQFALAGGQGPLDFTTDVTLGPPQFVQVAVVQQTGDTDCDADVDLDDVDRFLMCVTGPVPPGGPVPLPAACLAVDLDRDGDVDLSDFAILQRSFGIAPD